MDRPKAPGLRWIKRERGHEPYWRPTAEALRAGYGLKSVRLSGYADNELILRCHALQGQMFNWLAEQKNNQSPQSRFDGSIKSLLEIYFRDPDSKYQTLKPKVKRTYSIYGRVIERTVGARMIALVNGLDVKRWHAQWGAADGRLGAANFATAVLKAALSFGVICNLPGCKDLLVMARELKLAKPRPRTAAPVASDIEAARKAAHAVGRPLAALGYALQFEGTIRAWDVIGQWVPLSDPRLSTITAGGEKWIGPTWEQIGPDWLITITPSKTERTTGKRVTLDLSEMPMVLEEIELIPESARTGPLVKNEYMDRPYYPREYSRLWRRVRKVGGLSAELWNRDIRAGAVTEGGKGGATADDRAKIAGHAKAKMVAEVYDRDTLEAARRVAKTRKAFRTSREP